MKLNMLYKSLIFLTLLLFLKSCNTVNNLNDSLKSMTKTFKENCASNPKLCDNQELCNEAVLSGKWQTRPSYIPYVKEAWQRGLSCEVQYSSKNNKLKQNLKIKKDCTSDPILCSNVELCENATLDNEWEIRSYYQNHVSLAKQKGLKCNVLNNNKKNKIDKMMKYALKRLVKLNFLSNSEREMKEKTLENMDNAKFNKLYKFCKNAFAKSEPNNCDNAIKDLN